MRMKGRPDEEALMEMMEDMNGMDREKIGKKRGPSITIAIGMPKGKPEGMEEEMPEMEEEKMEGEMPSEMPMGDMGGKPPMEESPAGSSFSDEFGFDAEETALIEEAKALGIEDAEEIDMRLLRKMVDRKKATV